MEIDAKITVVCEGRYRPAKPDFISDGYRLPGDPEEVQDFKVFLVRTIDKPLGGQRAPLDITNWLSDKEWQKLYNEYLEACREEL